MKRRTPIPTMAVGSGHKKDGRVRARKSKHFSMSDQECRRNQIPGPVAAFVGRREPVDTAEPAITHRPAGSQGSLQGLSGGERQDSSAAVAKCDGPKLVHAGQTLPSKHLFAYRPNLPTARTTRDHPTNHEDTKSCEGKEPFGSELL